MSETTEKLVGIQQVLMPEFKAALAADATQGYMWFVRDNNISLHNYIYLGSRLYGEAEIQVPLESIITNVTSDNSIIVTKTDSELGTTVNLKVNLDPEGGLSLTENGLQVDMTKFISQSELDLVKEDIKTVNDNLVTSVNTINQNMADGFNTINGGIDNEIRPAIAENTKAIEGKVSYSIFQKDGKDVKTIMLDNYANLIGQATDGTAYNLAMVSKWDVADYGTTHLPINLNGSKDRPTYNDTKDIALSEDITNEANRVNTIVNTINDNINTINENLVTEIRPAISELQETKVSYVNAEKDGKNYKVIQLDNYANLVGEGTEEFAGETFNIGMVSKWNKVDLGSASLPINLNGKAERPTYNDTKDIALSEDIVKQSADLTAIINTKVSSVELLQDADNHLQYVLMVDGSQKGNINIPKDQFLKDVTYDSNTTELIFTFDTENGEKITKVNIGELVDTYEAGNGLELTTNIFSIKLDANSQSYITVSSEGLKIVGIDEAIASVNTKIDTEKTRAEGIEAGLRTDIDYEHTRALEAEANINKSLDTKVTWDESKSKIVLPSGGQLVGTKFGTDGSNPADGATIAQLNEWSVMDFGSPKYPLNLNVPKGVRPTVQEADQTGENANKIAYLSDITALDIKVSGNTDVIATKVDKVDGMGLSENSFTNADKTKLENLVNYDDTTVKNDILLNTNAITALGVKVSGNTDVIATKVDKVEGMSLSENSFTNADKTKLNGLENYDDTTVKNDIADNKTAIGNLQTGLTAEIGTQATNFNNLNTQIGNEVTRATNKENAIDTKIDNILNNGLELKNGKSISAEVNNPTGSPVNILTIKPDNTVEVGSNIGKLILKSSGAPSIITVIDGTPKEIALKEQVDVLTTALDELKARVAALEAKP